MLFGRKLAGVLGKTALLSAVLAGGACAGTNDHEEPTCLAQPADGNCSPALYGLHNGVIAPTFQDVFTNTLQPICAASGCHSGDNPPHGLKLDEINTAYTDLMAKNAEGQDRVIPGNLQCGKVIVRLETANEPWSMPPGHHLDAATLCAIQHWIGEGAPGP